MNRKKVVFLDRDGVINCKAPTHHYIFSWEEFKVLPRVCEAIKQCNQAGYYVVVVSNQRGIARGICTRKQIDLLHQQMLEKFAQQGVKIDRVYVCPHGDGECRCRKPKPGLFYIAEAELWKEKKERIDKDHSWMIGDSESDVDAGKKYGVRTILINNSNNTINVKADYVAKDLYESVTYLLQAGKDGE